MRVIGRDRGDRTTLLFASIGVPLSPALDGEGYFHTGGGHIDDQGHLIWEGGLNGANAALLEIGTELMALLERETQADRRRSTPAARRDDRRLRHCGGRLCHQRTDVETAAMRESAAKLLTETITG